MKNILVLVHDDSGQEARFQTALDVTRTVEGHLKCLDVVMLPVIAGDYFMAESVAILLNEEQKREAENSVRLQERLAREDVSWEWIHATGDLSHCINEASGLADLIVISLKLDEFPCPDMRRVAGDVLLNARKPILAVPEACTGFDAGGRVLVAWNGSTQAMTALVAATPLMRHAGEVLILEIADGSVEAPAEEAAAYLSRHGIHPEICRVDAGSRDTGDVIIGEVENRLVDYVVMGAYGQARFIEALLGGSTRRMLTDSPVPVLFAH